MNKDNPILVMMHLGLIRCSVMYLGIFISSVDHLHGIYMLLIRKIQLFCLVVNDSFKALYGSISVFFCDILVEVTIVLFMTCTSYYQDNPTEKDINQGALVVYNLDSSVSNDDLHQIYGVYGEIKEVIQFRTILQQILIRASTLFMLQSSQCQC